MKGRLRFREITAVFQITCQPFRAAAPTIQFDHRLELVAREGQRISAHFVGKRDPLSPALRDEPRVSTPRMHRRKARGFGAREKLPFM